MNTQSPDFPDMPDSDDLRAAEYVLGLLDVNARREAQARVGSDAGFAAQVASWETYFSPWLTRIAPVEVPSALWPRIRAKLWQHELPNREDVAARSGAPVSLWNRLAFWRGLAGGGFVVAAASLATLFIGLQQPATVVAPSQPRPQPVATTTTPAAAPMVVSLRHDDGSTAYSATVDADTGVITLIPATMPKDSRVPELWLIDSGGTPHSLGVLSTDHAMRVTVPKQFLSQTVPDAVFAVSLEPSGGSPTGLPTGPVVAKGNLIRL